MLEAGEGKALRFEFRLEDLTISGKVLGVIALRGAWPDADPDIAEYADLADSPPDSAISKQQAIWFIAFMRDVAELPPLEPNQIPESMLFKIIRICEALMEVSRG